MNSIINSIIVTHHMVLKIYEFGDKDILILVNIKKTDMN